MGSCISSDAAAVVYGISVENGCACHLFKMVGASDMMMMGLQTETALFFIPMHVQRGPIWTFLMDLPARCIILIDTSEANEKMTSAEQVQ
jgi:hypothetical protein